MRIGLYLDLAVGAAPDGAATWADRDLVVPAARIGAPPDMLNDHGQDWGLAPIAPATLAARSMAPLDDIIGPLMAHGAIRIDHVMAGTALLDSERRRCPWRRLCQLPACTNDRRPCQCLASLPLPDRRRGSRHRAFRLSRHHAGGGHKVYRVLWFERDGEHFRRRHTGRPRRSPVSTHDLPTLAGWWAGSDIALRAELGTLLPERIEPMQAARAHDRRMLLDLHGAPWRADAGLLRGRPRRDRSRGGERHASAARPHAVALAGGADRGPARRRRASQPAGHRPPNIPIGVASCR